MGTPTKRPISNDSSPADDGPTKNLKMDAAFSQSKKIIRSPVLGNSSINVPVTTKNRFDALSNAGDDIIINDKKNIKEKKPPPICIIGAMNFSQAINIINKITNNSNYFIKYMSIGTKLQLSSIDIYKQVVFELKKAKINFYTHDIKSEKTSRFILSGLPEMDNNEIDVELKNKGLDPVQINKLTVKNPRFANEVLYQIHFVANSTNLKDLSKIKAINHVIVTWKTHIQRNKGPTQCSRCQMFGHGGKNCHLIENCRKCGDQHDADSCSTEIEKCANCLGSHRADDEKCPKKMAFVQMRHKLSTAQRSNYKKKADFHHNLANFPPLPAAPRQPNWWAPAPQLEQIGRNIGGNIGSTISDQNSDLFSQQEILAVTREVLSGLRQCRSKEEQLNLIITLSIKFLYGNKP